MTVSWCLFAWSSSCHLSPWPWPWPWWPPDPGLRVKVRVDLDCQFQCRGGRCQSAYSPADLNSSFTVPSPPSQDRLTRRPSHGPTSTVQVTQAEPRHDHVSNIIPVHTMVGIIGGLAGQLQFKLTCSSSPWLWACHAACVKLNLKRRHIVPWHRD